jgi:hypothetical protein
MEPRVLQAQTTIRLRPHRHPRNSEAAAPLRVTLAPAQQVLREQPALECKALGISVIGGVMDETITPSFIEPQVLPKEY